MARQFHGYTPKRNTVKERGSCAGSLQGRETAVTLVFGENRSDSSSFGEKQDSGQRISAPPCDRGEIFGSNGHRRIFLADRDGVVYTVNAVHFSVGRFAAYEAKSFLSIFENFGRQTP